MSTKGKMIKLSASALLAVLVCLAPENLHSQTPSASTQALTNRFYSASGKWMAASNTNCLIWDSFPRKNESVTWSGAVANGKADGIGVVQWFTNGIATTTYQGAMKEGLADGHGITRGYGYSHEGEWTAGHLTSKTVSITYPGGGWYKGDNRDGFKEGHGEELMKGGVRYVGQFHQDRFEGPGEMVWPNGDKIAGEWEDSKLKGIGIYTANGGDSFKVKMTEKGIERQ